MTLSSKLKTDIELELFVNDAVIFLSVYLKLRNSRFCNKPRFRLKYETFGGAVKIKPCS